MLHGLRFSRGSVYLFTRKTSFSQLLLMDSLLQRILSLIQLKAISFEMFDDC